MDYCSDLKCSNEAPCALHEEPKKPANKIGECQVCCCDGEVVPMNCEHFTCFDCMKQYAAVQIEQGITTIKCPTVGCEISLSSDTLHDLLGADERFIEFFGGNKEVAIGTIQVDGKERPISDAATFTPPGFLQPLPPYLNDLLGPGYFRLGVFADGSCFYHALYELMDKEYHAIDDRKTKRELGWAKRKAFAQALTAEDVKNSGVFVHLQDDPNRQNVKAEDILSRVGDPNKWAEDEDFLLVQHKLKVNLWILELGGTSDVNVDLPPGGLDITRPSKQDNYDLAPAQQLLQQQRPNLLLLYLTNLHFEPIVRVEKGAMQVACEDEEVLSRLRSVFLQERAKFLAREKAFLRT